MSNLRMCETNYVKNFSKTFGVLKKTLSQIWKKLQ